MNDPYADHDTPYRDEELLREMYCRQGLNVNQIADELDCAASTVYRWVNNYELEPPEETTPWRDADTLEYLFYERGYTRQEIADRFNVWDRTVNRWLRRHDLQPETQSLRTGRLAVTANGYVQFVDYNGPNDDTRVYIHRLLALRDHSLEEVAENHVHHENRVPWLNYPENIEIMDASDHARHHLELRHSGNV